MRINIGQSTNLFHVDALNRGIQRNMTEKEEKAGILFRKDTAAISPMGRASSMLQNLANQLELSQEGNIYQNPRAVNVQADNEKITLNKPGQEAVFNNIIENSDNGFNRPTVESQLRIAYNDYLNEAYEKGGATEEDVYEYIVNIYTDSLAKAYQDVYNDIVKGYEDGTREVWTQNFDEGADYTEFELDGKNYRFHKLTMEEELDQLNKAYEKTARDAEISANAMIDQVKALAKIMPEYREQMRSIEEQIARREGFEVGESTDMLLERIKDKVTLSEDVPEKFNIYEMLMEARTSWLKQFAKAD